VQWAPKAGVVARPKAVTAKPAAVKAATEEVAEVILIPPPPPALVEPSQPAPIKAETSSAPPKPEASARPWLRTAAAAAPVASAPSTSSWRMIALGVVVVGLGAAALYQRRRRSGLARAVRSDLTVVSAARVGNKAQVVVVNVGGRKLLLGVTEAEVSHLAWLDNDLDAANLQVETQDEFDALPARSAGGSPAQFAANRSSEVRAPVAPPAPAPRRFRELLFNALGQEDRRAVAPTALPSAADQIAASTEDVVTRGVASRIAAPAGAPEMVDVEGQARGLILRLQKRA
jgi:flagellar biogenesis protein FliO